MKQIIWGSTTGNPNAGLTVYNNPASTTTSVWNSSENAAEFYFPFDVTLNNFSVLIDNAPGAGETRRFVVRKNATTDTALDVTISDAGTSATLTLATPVSISAGEYITIKCVSSAGVAVLTSCIYSLVSTSASKVYALSGARNQTAINDDVRRFWYPWGGKIPVAVTTDTQINRWYFAQNAVIKTLNFYLSTAPGGTDSWVFSIYKNGVEEASSIITIAGASTTGALSNLNISVAPTDNITLSVVSVSLPVNNQFFKWSMTIQPEIDGEVTYSNTTSSWSNGVVNYSRLTGTGAATTTEALARYICPPNTTFYMKKYYVNLVTAPGAGKSRALRWRKNTANANNLITISDAATSGTDLASIDSYTTGDFVDLSSTPTGTPATSDGTQYAVLYIPPLNNNIQIL